MGKTTARELGCLRVKTAKQGNLLPRSVETYEQKRRNEENHCRREGWTTSKNSETGKTTAGRQGCLRAKTEKWGKPLLVRGRPTSKNGEMGETTARERGNLRAKTEKWGNPLPGSVETYEQKQRNEKPHCHREKNIPRVYPET